MSGGGPAAFSVIIPTRNRPALLARAIASVRAQRDACMELIIVDDGTEALHADALQAVEADLRPGEAMIHLAVHARGRGSSAAINAGAERARHGYLCFLDDDDVWTDPLYLARAARTIEAGAGPDVLYFQQRAVDDAGRVAEGAVWLEGLMDAAARPGAPEACGAYAVDVDFLLQSGNFCHLNTTIVARGFFGRLGGLDTGLLYENDRDFYLRCIDAADRILFAPFVVSQHHIPARGQGANLSTSLPPMETLRCQERLFLKSAASCRHAGLRRMCARQAAYTRQKMALLLRDEGRFGAAFLAACVGLARRLAALLLV